MNLDRKNFSPARILDFKDTALHFAEKDQLTLRLQEFDEPPNRSVSAEGPK